MSLRSRLASICAIALLALGTACHWGTRAGEFPPARLPVGARVAMHLRGDPIVRVGELFAVDSSGVTVRGERLMHVRWNVLDLMDVDGLGGGYDVDYGGTRVTAAQRARLAIVSRFPQGLSGELLARVLALVGQSKVDEVP
jgi:hypothetical protein